MSTPGSITRNQSAPDPAVDQEGQDTDPAISPAPTELPRATSAGAKKRLITQSLEQGIYVTILRKQSVNGRTVTGVLYEAEPASGEGASATAATYVLRTGQPGRPVKIKEEDIQSIINSQTPVTVDEAEALHVPLTLSATADQ